MPEQVTPFDKFKGWLDAEIAHLESIELTSFGDGSLASLAKARREIEYFERGGNPTRLIMQSLDRQAQEVPRQALEPVGEEPDFDSTVAVHGFPDVDGDWVKLDEARSVYRALEEKLEYAELSWKGRWEEADKLRAEIAERQPEDERESTEEETSGVDLIAVERRRQTQAEGWTPDHDDEHQHRELVAAAVAYASYAGQNHWRPGEQPPGWPWGTSWWKPSGEQVRDLVKAGALIAAEIDRLQRATQSEQSHTEEGK